MGACLYRARPEPEPRRDAETETDDDAAIHANTFDTIYTATRSRASSDRVVAGPRPRFGKTFSYFCAAGRAA
jgi:hypothetical protein